MAEMVEKAGLVGMAELAEMAIIVWMAKMVVLDEDIWTGWNGENAWHGSYDHDHVKCKTT